MANKVTVRQREQKWWMQEGEETPQEYASRLKEEGATLKSLTQRPLREKYDTNRFQPGWNGKDAPGADKMGSGYAKDGDGKQNWDNLGASQGKKTSKGSIGEVTVDDVKEARRILALAKNQMREELLDDEFEDDQGTPPPENGAGPDEADGFEDEGLGGEGDFGGDVPPEMEDEGFEGEGGDMADDVTVEIGGQRYSLVLDEDEMGDEGFEGDAGGEGFSMKALKAEKALQARVRTAEMKASETKVKTTNCFDTVE